MKRSNAVLLLAVALAGCDAKPGPGEKPRLPQPVPAEASVQRIFPLDDREMKLVDESLSLARDLAKKYAKGAGEGELDPPLLDAIYAAWLAQPPAGREDPADVIDALGTAFGRHLCETLEMRWVMVRDPAGTDLAVQGAGGDLAYPLNSVAKRLGSGEKNIFVPLYKSIKAQKKPQK